MVRASVLPGCQHAAGKETLMEIEIKESAGHYIGPKSGVLKIKTIQVAFLEQTKTGKG